MGVGAFNPLFWGFLWNSIHGLQERWWEYLFQSSFLRFSLKLYCIQRLSFGVGLLLTFNPLFWGFLWNRRRASDVPEPGSFFQSSFLRFSLKRDPAMYAITLKLPKLSILFFEVFFETLADCYWSCARERYHWLLSILFFEVFFETRDAQRQILCNQKNLSILFFEVFFETQKHICCIMDIR